MNPFEPTDLIVIVGRDEVESGLPSTTLACLEGLVASPTRALSLCECVDIAFHGYDDDGRELWEIPDVRRFVSALDDRFPFWLYCANTLASTQGGSSRLRAISRTTFRREHGRVSRSPARRAGSGDVRLGLMAGPHFTP
jgi:hypothetical protein